MNRENTGYRQLGGPCWIGGHFSDRWLSRQVSTCAYKHRHGSASVLRHKSGCGGIITPVGFISIRVYADILLLVWFAKPRQKGLQALDTQEMHFKEGRSTIRGMVGSQPRAISQRPDVAPSMPDHRAATTTTTTSGPTANLVEPQNSPSTSAINPTWHTLTYAETLNAHDHLNSHINEIAQVTPISLQEQTLTSIDAYASTPITATITDALMLDPETSSQFTAITTNTKVETPSVPTKEDKTQNGPNTIAPTITAQPLATWKRKNKAQRPKDSKDADKPHLGPKWKSSGIILDTSRNADKKQRIEDETMSLSKMFAIHLGLVVAAMQNCRIQWVPSIGTVGGLGTPTQFVLLREHCTRKLPNLSS